MFWFFVQRLSKRDSWTSKMTTKMFWFFANRTVEICDLRGKCFDFLCKACGNLWLKRPCTKPFPRGGLRFWVYYIFFFKARGNLRFQKNFTGHPKWPRFEPVRPQWAAIQPSFFNLGQTFPQNFSKSQISTVFAQKIKTFFIHFRAKLATWGPRKIGNILLCLAQNWESPEVVLLERFFLILIS